MMTMMEVVGLVGVTLVISHGAIFDGVREWLLGFSHPANVLRWVGLVMVCTQCSGFWVGALWALALGKTWVAVFVAGGLVSVASVAADFVFRVMSAFADRMSGTSRNEMISRLLEARARKQMIQQARAKKVAGEPLTEEEADALLDEETEIADIAAS